MKKTLLALCLTALFLLSGCVGSGAASQRQNGVSAVQSVLDSGVAAADGATTDAAGAGEPVTADAARFDGAAVVDEEDAEMERLYAKMAYNEKEGIDIDLTQLNGTMIFSQVNRMVYEPEKFVGKTVRMAGRFAFAFGYNEDGEVNPEQVYFACIIPDATACCSSGIEFERAGNYQYPADYPEEGDDITVTGVFEMYEEYGTEYCRLADAVMEA